MKTYKQYQPFTVGTPLLARADGEVHASPSIIQELNWLASNITSINRDGKEVHFNFSGASDGVRLLEITKSIHFPEPESRGKYNSGVKFKYDTHDAAMKAGAKFRALLALAKDRKNVDHGVPYVLDKPDGVSKTYSGSISGKSVTITQTVDYVVDYDKNKAAELSETSKKNAEAASAQAQADNLNEQTKRSKAVRLTALIATGVLVAGIVALVIVNLTKK